MPFVYKNYLLILLMVMQAFNYLDQVALGIVLQDIKGDLQLSDAQLGFLGGIAFALFYSVAGIPIARWADRGNRVTIISVTAALWSAAVALCGAATSFIQMLLIRTCVAVGEAGCVPPALSLIADHFKRNERPRAVSIYMLGAPLALTIGYFAAGWVNEWYGWRVTFVVLGLPGLPLAALAWLTLIEPRLLNFRDGSTTTPPLPLATTPVAGMRFKDVCAKLYGNAAFLHLLICYSLWNFFAYGILQWTPSLFIRSHGFTTGELGTWFALIYGVVGGVGVYLGGKWASRYAAGNERLQLQVCALALGFFAVLAAVAFVSPDDGVALSALALGALGGNMAQGPVYATMQTLVPAHMRAISIALVLFFSNLIGMGLGPFAVGALSDALHPWLGEQSLRYALVVLCPGYFWAAWHLWRASRTVARDLAAAQVEDVPRTEVPTQIAIAESR